MMRPINRCLNTQLLDLCQRVVQLDELNNKVKALLPANLSQYSQVGSFNQGCLLITTTNATWATELRYCLPELRDKLRKAGLYQLTSIKISVVEADCRQTAKKQRNRTHLSTKARTNIRQAGELCDYQPLKDALFQLAEEESSRS